MKVKYDELKELMKSKLVKAGLHEEDADTTSEILTWSDERGFHSHGAVRVEYYAERIAKGGITIDPEFSFTSTGPCTGTYYGDNGCGYVAATNAMKEAIQIAKTNGIAVVGIKNISHSGAIGYYTEMAAKENLVALSMCQSDPMAVPFGGREPYFGTNPISFAAPSKDDRIIVFDMATTVQAWGKILYARSKKEDIPSTWAVDEAGNAVTDSSKVNALVPIAGAKGYGLMMMVDILAGVMMGVPFGKHVSSMYEDLTKGRDLGQIHIVLDPNRFLPIEKFKENISTVLDELSEIQPADGFTKVCYPGEIEEMKKREYEENGGIEIVDDLYEYLLSEDVHFDRYHNKNRFAE